MGASTFRELHALQVAPAIQARCIDPTNHLQRIAVTIGDKAKGRAALAEAFSALAGRSTSAPGRKTPAPAPASWAALPLLHRRMVAHIAGLDVVAKIDRELTEAEKAKLRQAARELAESVSGLVRL